MQDAYDRRSEHVVRERVDTIVRRARARGFKVCRGSELEEGSALPPSTGLGLSVPEHGRPNGNGGAPTFTEEEQEEGRQE